MHKTERPAGRCLRFNCTKCARPDWQLKGRLWLMWPPSVNSYWRSLHRLNRVVISAEGREYCRTVARQVADEGHNLQLAGRLSLIVRCYPPDRRRRDIDNILKVLLDSLTKAGVWQDDSQIDEIIKIRPQMNFIICSTSKINQCSKVIQENFKSIEIK